MARTPFTGRLCRLQAALWLSAALTLSCAANTLQLVSFIDSTQMPAAGGGGDSWTPSVSPDGRYVLFASTANNLILNASSNPIPALTPRRLNVFLRDRTNAASTLVSLNLAGTGGGNGDSTPSGISSSGRYVLFESSASDLVLGDTNNASDVFVRDLTNGANLVVSASTNGGFGNGASRSAAITPDGRFVAFVSDASNFVPGDTNGIADVFVRDLQSGQATLASVGAQSTPSSISFTGGSEAPDITPNGRYVAFYSTATNLVPGLTNVGNIYVRDLLAGSTVWASSGGQAAVQASLGATNAVCYNHAISADGQFVAYQTSPIPLSASNRAGLVLRYHLQSGLTDVVNTNAYVPTSAYEDIRSLDMTPDGRFIAFVANTNGTSGSNTCIYLWDGLSGATTLVSGDLSNAVPANSICDWPSIDPTGRFVAFLSSATSLTTNSLVGDFHVYLRDVQAGVTLLVDGDTNGVGSAISPATAPRLSANGQVIAFEAPDASLVPNDRNHDFDVFARDLGTGAVELISTKHPALTSLSPNGPSTLSAWSVNLDGRFVAFSSEADNLVPNDTNGFSDVFVRDLTGGTNILISMATNGAAGDGGSTEPAISADGRFVAFTSRADNLVAGDTNNTLDVFLRDVLNGTTTLVSVSTNGVSPGSDQSYSPILSADAKYVLFRSRAKNLSSSPSILDNLFLRNLQSGTNYALTLGGISAAAMTADGHFVLFVGALSSVFTYSNVYLWDSQLNARVYTNTTSTSAPVGVSPDGNRLVYVSGTQLYAVDRAANTNWVIGRASSGSHAGLRFSGDSRFLTYSGSSPLDSTNQVYLYDFQTGTNLLLSQSFNSVGGGIDVSDSPTISSDGRSVAYRSFAGNLVPGDTNGMPDVFLYDRLSGATKLLSVSRFAATSSDNRSLTPVFTADSQTLFFESWASDLAADDFNHNSDLFIWSLYPSNSVPPFTVQIITPATLNAGPTLSWAVVSGKAYGVQFKNNLSDAWQSVQGEVTLVGDRGYCIDITPVPGQRFYRVVVLQNLNP